MIDGKNVVVTGAVAGHSRQTAEAFLRDLGANVQSAVNSATDLLITGERVGASKLAKARANGIKIVPWDEAVNGKGAAHAAPPRVERAAARTIAPMLCKNADAVPTGPGWLHEIKWDGFRGIATVRDGAVSIQSRSAKSDLTERFPGVAAALAKLPNVVLDGELVDLSAEGGTFEGLAAGGGSGTSFVAFDLLEVEGHSTMGLGLDDRKDLLRGFLNTRPKGDRHTVEFSPTWEDGEALLEYAASHGLEGIVSKRRSSTYREGHRGEQWVKIKLRRSQELVAVGWTPGEGARAGKIGSLVLAVNVDRGKVAGKQLVYAGCVGSGISPHDSKLEPLVFDRPESQYMPLESRDGAPREARWLSEHFVVQVAFQRWTEDGRLWHPSFKGVRIDKDPGEVVREP